jgi:hypothetical protein
VAQRPSFIACATLSWFHDLIMKYRTPVWLYVRKMLLLSFPWTYAAKSQMKQSKKRRDKKQ